jgi:tetratricopeptide (TPR) repeat protein
MKRSLFVFLFLAVFGGGPATAAVRFTEWTPESLDELMAGAEAESRLVMVLITQPDWCPACIHLDRTLLRNPEARDIEELTREWVVLEVLGYDAPGVRFLEEQGLSFLGTPTTVLLKPSAGSRRLGDARQLVSIVGAPEDYVARLDRAARGHDAIAEAQAAVRESPEELEAWTGLAAAYLGAGRAEAARRTYQSVLARDDLDAERRRALWLESIILTTQRVEKNHVRALEELDTWADAEPGGQEDEDLVFARAWSLLALDRHEEARALIQRHYLAPGTADALATYLYLVFRHPTDSLLAEAEALAREGVERYPEQRGRLSAAHGRLLRRQGRLAEAEAAFAAAVAATDPSSTSYETYVGQLDYVRQELSRGDGEAG